MLVLTRRPGEEIAIGDQITVTVLDIRGDVVRLGIAAPRDVRVDRAEVRRRRDALAVSAQRIQDAITAAHNTGARGRG